MNEIAKVKKEVKLKQRAEMVRPKRSECRNVLLSAETSYIYIHRYSANVFSVFSMSSVESKNASTITGSKALPDSSRIKP